MEKRVEFLVVDSGAFIKNSPLHEYADEIYTVKGVIKEIKDKATLQRLQFLPYVLHIKEPSPEACKYVLDFAKKTGDFANLSAVDMQIIALTYQLEKEYYGTEHLNTVPSCEVTGKPAYSDTKISGFYIPKKSKEENRTESDRNNANDILDENRDEHNSDADDKEVFYDAKEELGDVQQKDEESSADEINSDDQDCSDDEDSWLTPDNIAEIKEKMGGVKISEANFVSVACVTTDFSVQNVLIQMGLNVYSVDGMLITHTRVYILRCFSCYKTTNNVTKLFCPNCGNKTLKRVSVTVREDGHKQIHINFNRPINIRGTRFSLPTPQGGKHAVNPLVCEDQPRPQNRASRKALQAMDALAEDYVVQSSPFAMRDVYSRSAHLAVDTRSHSRHFFRKNPNASGRATGNRKRK